MSENVSHTEAAQARVSEIRAMREKIPNFLFPKTPSDNRRLNAAKSVPAEFVELTAVAVTNSTTLVRPGAKAPEELRDLMSYADAYLPVAEELEALAHFVRHSTAAARHKAGTAALNTYALTRRLAKQPETADLAPLAAAMREALGKKKRKSKTPEEPAPVSEVPSPSE